MYLSLFGIADTHLDAVIGETENAKDVLDQFGGAAEFLLDLVGCAEDMGVVLGEAADASHAAELAGLFVAIDLAEFGEAHGEFPIAAGFGGVNLDVVRAIHRLEQILLVVGDFDGGVLAVLVKREVPGNLVKLDAADVRGIDGSVAALEEFVLHEGLEFGAKHAALGHPKDQAGAHKLRDGEEAHLLANLAMIALARFLLLLKPGVEIGFVVEGGAVKALELRVLFVAAEIGGGDLEQLEGLHVAGAHHVRAGAKVDELAILIERNRFAFGDVVEALELELLAAFLEERARFVAGLDAFVEGLIFLHDLAHFILDSGEVLRREAMAFQVEVVIKAFVGRRPDVEAGIRPKAQHGSGHDMGCGMANALQFAHPLALIECLASHRLFGGFHNSKPTAYKLWRTQTNANWLHWRRAFFFGDALVFF